MFYESIHFGNDEEREWFEDQLQTVCVYGDRVYRENEAPDELKNKQPDKKGPRFLLDCEVAGDYEGLPFEYSILQNPPPGCIEVYTFSDGDPYPLAWLIHKYLKRFYPKFCYGFSYALGNTVPGPYARSVYGGGAFFVTADDIKWFGTDDFLENCYRKFEKRKAASRAQQ